MKTSVKFENSIMWHNTKKALFSLQILVMTMAIPVLVYAGLTHEDVNMKKEIHKIQVTNVKPTNGVTEPRIAQL